MKGVLGPSSIGIDYFIMNKNKEIQEQYLNLRYKVEGKIKELQGKLTNNSEPNSNNLHIPNNSFLPKQPHYHHNCHHIHHCHSAYNHNFNFLNQNNIIELSQAENQNLSVGRSNSKNSSVNEMISSALVESLKNQRQINDHIKVINQKIETLSAQHNRSNLSEAFSQSVSQNKIRVGIRNKKNDDQDKHRCLSEVKSQSRPSHKYQVKRITAIKLKKVKTKVKQNDQMSSNKNEQKAIRQKGIKSKSLAKNKSQYFLSFGCPLHSPIHQIFKSPSTKQVFKDSQFRNRKHEKNHLIQSFKQQQKSRKRLISKIAHNAFNEYSRN